MSTKRRSRAEIVAQNDRALREAAISAIVESGWDSITFTGVAKGAGLTVGAVYARAESPAELAIDIWQSTAEAWFDDSVTAVVDAAKSGDSSALLSGLRRWETDAELSAVVVDLLVGSLFDDDLGEVIGADARRILSRFMVPSARSPRVSRHEAAAATLVIAFALGRAIVIRGGVHPPAMVRSQAEVMAGMFGAPAVRGPLKPPQPLVWIRSMDDVDAGQRDLLRGALRVVGRVGYRRATIARIGRSAGVPRGSVLTHYDDKAQLVSTAAERGLIPPGEVWWQYRDVAAEHGPLVARAMFLASFLDEGNREFWIVNLELARLARFLPEFRAFRPTTDVLEHTHLGVMLAAALVPGLADLPFAGPFSAGTAT